MATIITAHPVSPRRAPDHQVQRRTERVRAAALRLWPAILAVRLVLRRGAHHLGGAVAAARCASAIQQHLLKVRLGMGLR